MDTIFRIVLQHHQKIEPSSRIRAFPFRKPGKSMRDQRFVAVHHGGSLSLEHHRLLIAWAQTCAEHVLPLFGDDIDERLLAVLKTAKAWQRGEISVGDARKASVAAHAVAREMTAPSGIAVARAVGHAVATAHMADHSLGAAWYALKAVKFAGQSIELERIWQNEQIPNEVKALVLSAREDKRFSRV
jgi:hypothetical protein